MGILQKNGEHDESRRCGSSACEGRRVYRGISWFPMGYLSRRCPRWYAGWRTWSGSCSPQMVLAGGSAWCAWSQTTIFLFLTWGELDKWTLRLVTWAPRWCGLEPPCFLCRSPYRSLPNVPQWFALFCFSFNLQVSPGWTEQPAPELHSSSVWRYSPTLKVLARLSSPPDSFNHFAHVIVLPDSFSSCYLSSGGVSFFISAHLVSFLLQEMSTDFNRFPSCIGSGEKPRKGAFICLHSTQMFQFEAQQSKVQSDSSCKIRPRKCNYMWMIFVVQKGVCSFWRSDFLIYTKGILSV